MAYDIGNHTVGFSTETVCSLTLSLDSPLGRAETLQLPGGESLKATSQSGHPHSLFRTYQMV